MTIFRLWNYGKTISFKRDRDTKRYCYHPNITFTVEENATHFLDTEVQYKDGFFSTNVFKKPGIVNYPITGHLKCRLSYKRNAIFSALYRKQRISSNLTMELIKIRSTFKKAGVTADLVPPRTKSASGIGPGGPYPRGTKSTGTPVTQFGLLIKLSKNS